MLDKSTVPNTSGSYPNTVATNSTTSTSYDGTPYRADVLNDEWGFEQALLNAAGLTPNGSNESNSNSQMLSSMRILFGHVGEIVIWRGNLAPSSYLGGLRLLLLQGQGVLASAYPDLVSTCYVGDANNAAAFTGAYGGFHGGFYKSTTSDGLNPSTSGAYFILPDARGKFVRFDDDGAQVDPEYATRGNYGQVQPSMNADHAHNVIQKTTLTRLYETTGTLPAGSDIFYKVGTSGSWLITTDQGQAAPAGAPTSFEGDGRPINVNLGLPAIRY